MGGLWGVPLGEGPKTLEKLLSRFGLDRAECVGQVRHTLTHKRLSVEIYTDLQERNGDDPGFRPLSVSDYKILRVWALSRTQDQLFDVSARGGEHIFLARDLTAIQFPLPEDTENEYNRGTKGGDRG